jgi:hypothetical protein
MFCLSFDVLWWLLLYLLLNQPCAYAHGKRLAQHQIYQNYILPKPSFSRTPPLTPLCSLFLFKSCTKNWFLKSKYDKLRA